MNVNLAQVRDHLEHRKAELLHRAQRVERDLSRVEGALSPDFSEQAVQVQNDQTLNEIARAATEELVAIEAALERITQGKYGVCKSCGDSIDEQRLVALPQSVYCVACSA
jgi:RNA polymerase-binding transcription factor DksA